MALREGRARGFRGPCPAGAARSIILPRVDLSRPPDVDADEPPIDRLRLRGPRSLADAELLSLLLRQDDPGVFELDAVRALLREIGLVGVAQLDVAQLDESFFYRSGWDEGPMARGDPPAQNLGPHEVQGAQICRRAPRVPRSQKRNSRVNRGSEEDGDSDGEPPGGSDGEPPGTPSPPKRPSVQRGTPRLPGLEERPWLSEPPPKTCRAYGTERRDDRGRVRVTLGAAHPYATSGGWQYRYRLVVAYALGRRLRPDEHVDHINGVVDDDRPSNLRLLTPEYHGRLHAWLFELAGCRGENGRFTEYRPRDVKAERAARVAPVISAREINPLTWRPVAAHLPRASYA